MYQFHCYSFLRSEGSTGTQNAHIGQVDYEKLFLLSLQVFISLAITQLMQKEIYLGNTASKIKTGVDKLRKIVHAYYICMVSTSKMFSHLVYEISYAHVLLLQLLA